MWGRLVSLPATILTTAITLGAAVGYADANACAACHPKIAADYAKTGMGRSFSIPQSLPTTVPDFYHQPSGTHFALTERKGQYYQKRWQTGFDGKETNVEELKIDYILGSGNHARSYLHRTERGTLIELPLGWYSEGGPQGRWGMSPGSDSDHPRTRRFVSYKCMFCHNAVPDIPSANQVPGGDPVYSGALPEGIDCQRCHGPGANHIKTVKTSGSTLPQIRASILNPKRLTPQRRMEICMQCHLETTSDRIPSSIVRFNRGPFSYRPGEPLEAFALSFDHAPGSGHDDKFEVVSSVYRLKQSKCFLRSGDKLTCDTCHNPHKALRGEEAVAHYTAACRQCHSSPHASTPGNCVECHMPRRRAEDTVGLVMTDHLIQRRPPPGNLVAERKEITPELYQGPVVPYYPLPLPKTPANALYLAVAQVGDANNLATGLPALEKEIAEQRPTNPEFYTVLGAARKASGQPKQAVTAYQRAVDLNPASPSALRALADALKTAGEPVRAMAAVRRALTLSPSDPEAWFLAGKFDFDAGRSSEAIVELRKAIALDPTLPDKSRELAAMLLTTGQTDQAQAAAREALRIDPYDEDAWDLSGRILMEKSEVPEALYNFKTALRLKPDSASHRYDYALALARAGQFDEAQTNAESALRADPRMPETRELLGGLFERRNLLIDAVREYTEALALRPGMARVHLRLGMVLAAQGNSAAALPHLQEASRSTDPAIARQAIQLMTQTGIR